MRSCLIFAVQADGAELRTVEGLAEAEKLSELQQAFYRNHALQCGYCTPGFLMTLQALAEQNKLPTEESEIRKAISGNICRCTGYQNIIDAVLAVAT
jgi:carbon-monoxide dehydrogenase small subunit